MANKKKNSSPAVYTEDELKKVEDHIEKYYGDIDSYYHENDTDDICLNIYVIPPTLEKRYMTLITAGLGAHRMNVPEEIAHKKLDRCELILTLPAGWNIQGDELEDYWPLHLLKLLSRLPINENSWIGWGHSVDYGTSFADNTEFCSVMLASPTGTEEMDICKLSDDDEVNFYRVIPLFKSELEFKNTYGASALLHELGDISKLPVDISRRPVISKDFRNLVDKAEDHICKIVDKELDIPEICGVNHIAAYLRWIIEHDMLNEEFIEFFTEEISDIRSGKLDIRKFILNSLGGELTMDMFNDEGMAFTDYYYNFYHADDEPCYPSDVDNVAMDYFGEEKYNCEEFGNEAYIFVPYNEEYYKAMCGYIDKNYKGFLEIEADD